MTWGAVGWQPSGWGAAVGLLVGAAAGSATRALAARLRRGAVLPRTAVVLVTALACGAVGALLWPHPVVWPAAWLAVTGAVLAGIDLRHHRLPDALTLPSALVAVVLGAITAAVGATGSAAGAAGRVVGAALLVTAVFGLVAALAPAAMGWGDVKLVAAPVAVAAVLSWRTVLLALLVAFVLAGLVALVGVLARRLRGSSAIPFGPFLVAGGLLAVLLDGSAA